ncbi:type II toxin-antitoxin system HigB family toxin [Flammeovirga sp. MY04]|uniref:type II toxin-antitoxin system HigB family toxin n=1 Tax=Flammeovirga sp. MY04 TaxID=1191459 RepID=UPI00080630AC|nr:type II toxin-antitoxin system HigB family toxin [Flammeovirga sp. MY04]ANQ51987.1 type II toxin-antitoxin system HigB family toxin [Flammeovirga sp. MY04]
MRIISEQTIKDFAEKHKNDLSIFKVFVSDLRRFKGKNANDLKKAFDSVDNVGNKRYVFNIKRNEYRMVALILFGQNILFVRFIGKHSEYDKIKDIKNI